MVPLALNRTVELLPYALRTETLPSPGTFSPPILAPACTSSLILILDVRTAGSLAADKLDVIVQCMFGETWVDMCSFPQVLGNGGSKMHVGKCVFGGSQIMFDGLTPLAAGTVRNVSSHLLRTRSIITDGGGTHEFGYAVYAVGM